MKHDETRISQIQKYNGFPKELTDKEISLWKKFLRSVLPWVTKKWELGNAYLEAKVVKEINEANKIKAETELLQIQAETEARNIIDITNYQEEVAAKEIKAKPLADEEIEANIKEIIEKMKLMYLKYGFKISISLEYDEGSDSLNELKNQNQSSLGQDVSKDD